MDSISSLEGSTGQGLGASSSILWDLAADRLSCSVPASSTAREMVTPQGHERIYLPIHLLKSILVAPSFGKDE